MPSSKTKKALPRPKSGRAYSGFGGMGLDQMYRIGSLSYPFSAGRWAGGGAPGGGGGGWGMAPGGPSGGGQDWSAPAFGGDYGAPVGAYTAGSPPVRGLAPAPGAAPVVTNIPSPFLPPGPSYSAPSYSAPSYRDTSDRYVAAPPAPTYKPGTGVMVGGTGGVAPHPISLGGGTNPFASTRFATTPVNPPAPRPVAVTKPGPVASKLLPGRF